MTSDPFRDYMDECDAAFAEIERLTGEFIKANAEIHVLNEQRPEARRRYKDIETQLRQAWQQMEEITYGVVKADLPP